MCLFYTYSDLILPFSPITSPVNLTFNGHEVEKKVNIECNHVKRSVIVVEKGSGALGPGRKRGNAAHDRNPDIYDVALKPQEFHSLRQTQALIWLDARS